MPLSIIEALVSGRIIIGAKVGGIPEMLENMNALVIDDFMDEENINLIGSFLSELDFYNNEGEKGFPSFEIQEL